MLCATSFAVAQSSMDSIQQVQEVEVYGKRPLATSQKLSGADLQALSTTSVADALKYFAGVQIKDYGGLGGLKTINVRSMGAQHVGVYVDGIRITNASVANLGIIPDAFRRLGVKMKIEGDDIVVEDAESKDTENRIPCLRQQQQDSEFLCLADFIAPHTSPLTSHLSPLTSKIGLFATSVDSGMESDFTDDPYEKMMMQLVADRLAEATAERLHEQVRKEFWGYAKDEQLSVADMLIERFQGIRPAVGYPSLPDTSLNFVIDRLIGMQQIGIRLTESGAMRPHASVSGLMMANPKARYFSIGRIGDDQLRDYAQRRDIPVELMRKFISGNL